MEYVTITISAITLNTIGAALQELPYKLANPAVMEIDKQVRQYLAEKESTNDRATRSKTGDTDGNGDGPGREYIDQDRQAG
jgi:hypothetical protein